MATSDILNCTCTDLHDRERVRYFPRQLMTADGMKAEQEYFRQKLRRHNRYLHGWGVVCGCEVKAFPDVNHPWRVRVCPGYIITPQGDEILIGDNVEFDLAGDRIQDEDPCAHPSPCSPPGVGLPAGENETVYLAACYSECNTHPVRVQPAGCGCDETACEYSRIRDSFKLVRLTELPQSHLATQKDTDWSNKVEAWLDGGADDTWPVPDCPDYPEDPCVVLATVTLPGARNTQITDGNNITYGDRHVLYSAQITQQFLKGFALR